MADAVTNFSALSTDSPNVWIASQMYKLVELRLQLGQWATKYTLPQRFGKTLRIIRYRRLTLPTSTLSEGVAPDALALSLENVDVTVEQWGIVVLLTDVAQITTDHPALNIAIERTALAMTEVLEREMAKVLLAGTNVYYGGTVSARSDLAASDKLTTTVVLKATSFLRSTGAMDWASGLYSGVMQPQQEADLLASDTTFQNASNFANVKALQYGEIGVWMGVRWVRGNFLPIFVGVETPDTAAATSTKAKYTLAASGGSLATANYKIKVVARDASNDYERKLSQTTGNLAVTGPSGSIAVDLPTSTNYKYDVYVTQAGGTTLYKVFSRQTGATTVTITTAPAGTEDTPSVAPANGVSTYVAWVFGKDGFGRVELSGMSLQSYITPAGPSYSNPLAQGRKVGSKLMWKCFIIDNSFFVRLETGSAFPNTLPA